MKKRVLLFALTILAFTACSGEKTSSSSEYSKPTSESSSSTSSSLSSLTENDLFIEFNRGDKLQMDNENGNYSYRGLALKRDDSFIIKNKKLSLGFSNLESNEGFKEGENNFIVAFNEGKYDLTIDLTKNVISMLKVDSAFENVSLYYPDSKIDQYFSKNSDFTYTLNDISLQSREEFQIKIDEDIYGYSFIEFSDDLQGAFSNNKEVIKVEKAGSFNFKIDFSKELPILITKNGELSDPTPLPTDGKSYKSYVSSLNDLFETQGTKLTATETIEKEDSIVKTNHLETYDLNQCYYKSSTSDEVYSERSRLYNETNYYEISISSDHKNDTLSGKLLGEQIANSKKEYISLENAQKNINTFTAFSDSLTNYLNNAVHIMHLTSYTIKDENEYLKAAKIEAKYLNDLGLAAEIKASNTEKQVDKNVPSNCRQVENVITFKTDGKGRLSSGSISVEIYEGNIFDVNGNLKASAKISEKRTYTFNFEYNKREMVKEFKLDPNVYSLSSYQVLSKGIIFCGSTIDVLDAVAVLNPDPMTAIDIENLIVLEFDENYFDYNWDKTMLIARKVGVTSVKIGLPYSDFEVNVSLQIGYKPLTASGLNISAPITDAYYENCIYEFHTEISSNCDPFVNIIIPESSKEYIELVEVTSDEEVLAHSNTYFKIKTLKACEEAKFEVVSRNYPTVKKEFKFKITPALVPSDFTGIYQYEDPNLFIEIHDDYTGVVKNGSDIHNFKFNLNGDVITLDESSTLSVFTAKVVINDKVHKLYQLKEVSIKDSAGNELNPISYAYFRSWLGIYTHDTFVDSEKNVTLNKTDVDLNGGSFTVYYEMIIDASTKYTFEFNQYSIYSSTERLYGSEFNINGVYTYGYDITITNFLDDNCFTLTIEHTDSSTNQKVVETYNFVLPLN